jgi:uncharacterized protein YecA (UPF0149 family)
MAQTTMSPAGELHTELFIGPTAKANHAAMDHRLAELSREGHSFVKRTRIGRNTSCPCGSGRKFKKCCIDRAIPTG